VTVHPGEIGPKQVAAAFRDLRTAMARLEWLLARAEECKSRLGVAPSITEQAEIIASIVARRTGVPEQMMHSPVRSEEVVRARQICMTLTRKFIPMSTWALGRLFERDKSSASVAAKVVQNNCDTDPSFKREYEAATAEVALALIKCRVGSGECGMGWISELDAKTRCKGTAMRQLECFQGGNGNGVVEAVKG